MHEQCVKLLKIVKGFVSYLVITDDILNDVSEQSIVRLLSNETNESMSQLSWLLLDAGWQVDQNGIAMVCFQCRLRREARNQARFELWRC